MLCQSEWTSYCLRHRCILIAVLAGPLAKALVTDTGPFHRTPWKVRSSRGMKPDTMRLLSPTLLFRCALDLGIMVLHRSREAKISRGAACVPNTT